jgi:hypothetical protein
MGAPKTAWKTTQTKDGKTVLLEWFYATNPLYVRVHNEWNWVECPLAEALAAKAGDEDLPDHPGWLGPSGGM